MNSTIASGLPALTGTLPTSPTLPSSSGAEGGFGATLKNAISQVNDLNDSKDQKVAELVQGGQGDVHNVMIAVEKADVAFQLMMQVRNKIVNAYQEVSKLQF
ncbi:MAG: flagellar hook-basal body complex protein FliE [Candidatus Sulfotelmatobacter sp.]|jgi:flagellar hook-basal body complex protein FliE